MTLKEIIEFSVLLGPAKNKRKELENIAREYVDLLEPLTMHPVFKSISEKEQNYYSSELSAIKQLLTREVME